MSDLRTDVFDSLSENKKNSPLCYSIAKSHNCIEIDITGQVYTKNRYRKISSSVNMDRSKKQERKGCHWSERLHSW